MPDRAGTATPSPSPPAPDSWAWVPGHAELERSRVLRFARSLGFAGYDDFLAWSQREPAAFWDAVMRDLDLQFLEPYRQTVDLERGWAHARWFRGGRYNFAWNAVHKWCTDQERDRTALLWEGEDGAARRLTRGELAAAVSDTAAGLRALGVAPGERVAVYLPMLPETAVTLLALGHLGALCVPLFSGHAAPALAERLRDSGARVLVTADGGLRRGRLLPMKETADAAADAAPCVRHVVVVPRLGRSLPAHPRDVPWHTLGTLGTPVPLLATDPEDACLLLYTSGTTGRPKGALHAHCGFPVKATQDMAHLFDVGAGDTLFWYSDFGWMMGPWAILGALSLGACCLLYEGTPDYPNPGRLWALAEQHGVTVLGVAPTVVRALMAQGDQWPSRYDLSRLRILGSSGEPWNPDPWDWFYARVGRGRCPIINYSGGTEISGGILGCVPVRPLRPCCFNTAVPGMAAAVLDEQGRPVRGEVGELAVTAPWPGMTRGFWNDPDGSRYHQTYWERWPGVWAHGDWARQDEEGCWYILGRSDDTIKSSGKRVGPAEVESAVCGHPAVAEAAAVGLPDAVKGERIAVFVVLCPGHEPGELLRAALRERVAAQLGRALRPDTVAFVPALPRTRNGKVVRRAVRAARLGEPPGDLSALENPEALDAIREAR